MTLAEVVRFRGSHAVERCVKLGRGLMLGVLGLTFGTASLAHAAPITSSPFGVDLDGNGQIETEGSYLTQQFTAFGRGSVTVRYMFLTSEAAAQRNNNDLFLMRLYSPNLMYPNDGDPTLVSGREAGGAVVNPGSSYTGEFDEYDFVNGTITRASNGAVVSAPAIGGPVVAPGGGNGLTHTSDLTDGGLGWQTATFSFFTSDVFELQFLLADAGDGEVDSALVIDQIEVTGSAISVGNGSFEINGGSLTNWYPSSADDRGEVGVYSRLVDDQGNTIVSPTDGDYFAVLGNVNEPAVVAPEPTAALILLGGAAGVLMRRR